MAGLFSRLKIWNPGESLSASDLNGEFNHFLSNIDAEHSEGYSANLSEMQTTENPGGLGSENLTQPISVAQEIERLRYVINRIIGKTYWYQAPAQSIEGLNNTITGVFGVSPSRIVSGQKTTLSGFPTFLQANGATGVRLNASALTPFNCFIDTNYFSYTSNISSGVLSGQPTNNTATLSSSLGGGQASREATEFAISGAGSSITANIGRQAIFSIVNGSNTEYFLGTIISSTLIGGIKRGYFYDTSNNPLGPIVLTTGHTITLLRTTYVFLRNDGTLQVSYNPPSYMGTAPISPSINDYWFDMTVNSWKIFNGTWIIANSIYIGMCAQGPTNTVCARSENFFNNYTSINGIVLTDLTNTSVSSRSDVAVNVSVYGSLIKNDFKDYVWDMTSNFIPGETESASTTYYFYLNNLGTSYISSVRPISEAALYGWYHPYEALRCIGFSVNDANSNLTTISQNFDNEYTTKNSLTIQRFTSNAATQAGVLFTITAGNATVGATYTNNSQTFTVLSSITSGTLLFTSNTTGLPLASGTLTKSSGTGDTSLTFSTYTILQTYTTPANVKYIRVSLVGGGGSGAGGGPSAGNGNFGSASAFHTPSLLPTNGTPLLIGNAGGGGAVSNSTGGSGGIGGSAIVNSPAVIIAAVDGGGGQGSTAQGSTYIVATGGVGGSSFFGGAGRTAGNAAGSAAASNSGSGGGGSATGGGATAWGNGGGGGAGGFADAIITNPLSSYLYTVGLGGASATGGSSGTSGAGGTGIVIVEEYYQ